MQFIDQAGTQELPDRGHAAPEANVAAGRRGSGLAQGRMDSVGDEVKFRAPGHLQWRPGMMCEDEHRCVIGRLIAPPALPILVRPGAADGTKHIATENPGADAGKALLGYAVVDSGLAAFLAMHLAPHAGME